jgi:hypothetical protein
MSEIAKYSIYYVNKMGEKKQIDLDDIVGITADLFFKEHPDCEYIVTTVRNTPFKEDLEDLKALDKLGKVWYTAHVA